MVSNPSMIGQSSEAEPDLSDAGPSRPTAEPAEPTPPARPPLDPTRYGDWEKNGRCIDF